MQELASILRAGMAALTEEYEQRLRAIKGYGDMPDEVRLRLAQYDLELLATCLAAGDGTPFVQFIRSRVDERLEQRFELEDLMQALTALEATLQPLVTTVDAALFLWRALSQARNVVAHWTAEKLYGLNAFNEGIIQNMAEGIAVEDAEGMITFVNPAAATLLGYTPEELEGRHWTIVVPPDQQPIIEAADQRRVHGEADRYEVELVRKDGMRRTVLISGSPQSEEGRFTGTLAVFTDSTALKRLEQEQQRLQREIIATQRRAIQELSSPVIQIWEGVLVLPLVGAIDSERARRTTEDLLHGIVARQAEQVIIDITGVPVVDTGVAHYLLQTIKAARLLGARCLLVGIRSEVAQAMVHLGIDLSGVVTRANLQGGIEYVLAQMGLAVGARGEEV